MNNIEKYEEYLGFLNKKIEKFFEQEKDFICCKEGCSLCCETGNYPFSKLEFDYIIKGSFALPKETIEIIDAKIKKLKAEKANSKEELFLHECPFLINKKCSLYDYRALICRTFGLIYYDDTSKLKLPSCVDNDLNYAKVYNKETKKISDELVKNSGLKEPMAYNLSLKALKENQYTKDNIDFGETKPLLDWFE